MRILYTFPPNYAELVRVFDVRGKPIWFCYGDTLHNPGRRAVPPPILRHEKVHSGQQGSDPAGWWRRYIDDIPFRLAQEIEAHLAEVAWWREWGGPGPHFDRAVALIAKRLAMPLYGSLITVPQAHQILRDTAWPSSTASAISSS